MVGAHMPQAAVRPRAFKERPYTLKPKNIYTR